MELMDTAHVSGINFILWMQHEFKGHEELMLFLSHIGDPRNAFLIYFPLAYFCHRSTGIKVMWAGVISEWLNAVFKWVLFGHRPYWWVHTSSKYDNMPPHLEQFRLTCETGPGSPSGHAMVTAAVMFVLIRAVLAHKLINSKIRHILSIVAWTLFILLMSLVSLSRCFIATHFPHQVIAGIIVGVLIGEVILRLTTDDVPFLFCALFSLTILLTGPLMYFLVESVGYDPKWSISLAMKWCAKAEWIHLDTTLFYAFTRDASVLLGTGLGLWKTDKNYENPELLRIIPQIVASVVFARGMEYVHLPQYNQAVFYFLAFVKYFFVFYVIVVFVAKMPYMLFPKKENEGKNR